MRQKKYGKSAVIIGKVIKTNSPQVRLRTAIGGTRLIDMLPGEMLPRIC
jgi:hydrogenase expression/formation protein HypE